MQSEGVALLREWQTIAHRITNCALRIDFVKTHSYLIFVSLCCTKIIRRRTLKICQARRRICERSASTCALQSERVLGTDSDVMIIVNARR